MDGQSTTKDNSEAWRKDFLFVSSMILTCCVFGFGLIAIPFWFSNESQRIISANATSTANAVATQQTQYEIVDRFDASAWYWSENSTNDEYSVHQKKIAGGIYTWNVDKVKKPFVVWENFYLDDPSSNYFVEPPSNYDVYVDTRIVKGTPGTVCSGLVFRESPDGWDQGAFIFVVCNDSTYALSYYDQKDDWQNIVPRFYSSSIRKSDWNRLGISSRGAQSVMFINGEMIYVMVDERQIQGDLALIINVNEAPAKVQFDNFGYQSR